MRSCRLIVAVVALAAAVGGCATRTGEADRSAPPRSLPRQTAGATFPSASTLETPASAGAGTIVFFARLITADFGVVAVGPAPNSTEQSGTRLLAGTATGDRFRDVGPKVPAGFLPDSVFFLDPEHGWFTTFWAGGGAERLYRTRDGGTTWQSFAVPSHSENAGSTDQLDFISPSIGWLAVPEPTAPSERLYTTTDGGASWQPIAGTRDHRVPAVGFVRFAPDGRDGWLGALPNEAGFAFSLYRTADSGLSWHRTLAATSQTFAVPETFGATEVATATSCVGGATSVSVYVSRDGGDHWSPPSRSTLGIDPTGCRGASRSFPDASTGWATTLDHGAVAVYRTTDDGRTWSRLRTPVLRASFGPRIQACDADHAWLLVPGLDVNNTRIYATADAGATWTRVDQNATA